MVHTLDARGTKKEIYPSALKLGGESPSGDRIGFTNYYMERNGEPFFAICGEFHYSRYPAADWETELLKMRMSGINVVATYIFWNHHEEEEGSFEWSGNFDLRAFTELCGKLGLDVILRVGPFCHGEVRNGGIPDWLFGRPFEVRSNDEGYLAYVATLYREIGRQVSGLMFGDGGPVIGIQLENEFMAAAALWELTAKQGDHYITGGTGGAEHMRRLKDLAMDAGLAAPVYTSTGWGGAPFLEDEVLSLYGGYAYTPWGASEMFQPQPPTAEYIFRDFHSDAEKSDTEPSYPMSRYPFACCEMGGGMQTWYKSRFVVDPESVAAMTLVKIAGGCNFLGYYMFHGGTNPVGKTGFLNESTTPKITYDFQAVIGEFGQIRESNDRLRPLHYFLHRFGKRLAPLATVLPDGAESVVPADIDTLRYAVRTDGHSGFLFLNNYQDHVEMKAHRGVEFEIRLDREVLRFPRKIQLTVERNVSAMLPFNFDMDGILLRYATVQPVTAAQGEAGTSFFFAMPDGMDAELCLAKDGISALETEQAEVEETDDSYCVYASCQHSAWLRIRRSDGSQLDVYLMTAEEARRLWVGEIGGCPRLLFSDVPVVPEGTDGIGFISFGRETFGFREFAAVSAPAAGWPARAEIVQTGADGRFVSYQAKLAAKTVPVEMRRLSDRKVVLQIGAGALDGLDDLLLRVEYEGDVAFAFSDGKLFHDHFHNGEPWEIGLSRFPEVLASGEIVLETTPMRKGSVTLAAGAAMAAEQIVQGESVAVIRSVTVQPVYRFTVPFLTSQGDMKP